MMNIGKMNDLIVQVEEVLRNTPYNDPMYDYNRGKKDGILAVMSKLGYIWTGDMGGFRRDRKA